MFFVALFFSFYDSFKFILIFKIIKKLNFNIQVTDQLLNINRRIDYIQFMTTLDKSTIKITEISLQEEVKKTNELWTEIKCVGKSIKRRSYHSSVIYKSEYFLKDLDCMCMEDMILTQELCLISIKLISKRIVFGLTLQKILIIIQVLGMDILL